MYRASACLLLVIIAAGLAGGAGCASHATPNDLAASDLSLGDDVDQSANAPQDFASANADISNVEDAAVDLSLPKGTSTLPAAVIAAGYTQNTFATPSFSASNIDLKQTNASGFQWYPWSWGTSHTNVANIIPNSDGSLTLAGDTTGPNGEILTAIPAAGGKFVGTAFGGGAYFEATFKFDPQKVIDAKYVGWPSWWGMPIDHFVQSAGEWWNGDPSTSYNDFVETDFFEYDIQAAPTTNYSGALHQWYGVYKTTCTGGYCDWHTPYNEWCPVTAGTDWNAYHAAGFLWIPATATKPGSATFYFDRKVTKVGATFQKWDDPPIPTGVAPATPQPSWAFSWMDHQHYALILGTGVNEPMVVENVSVWQASGADNQHE